MSAAELLRGLDKAATAPRWEVEDNGDGYITGHIAAEAHRYCGNTVGRRDSVCAPDSMTTADAPCIATTRNLLPLLAGLVEAVQGYVDFNSTRRHAELIDALDALNAAAAKEA